MHFFYEKEVATFVRIMRYFSLVFLFTFLLLGCNSTSNKKKIQHIQVDKKKAIPSVFSTLLASYIQGEKKYIHRFFTERIANRAFNGMFLVAKNGEILYERYLGKSNFENGKKLTVQTPLHVASVSKVITAVCVLKLVDQGKINLDDPVIKYLPELPYPSITVRMLLNHRSGIQYYAYFTSKNWPEGKTLYNKDILSFLAKYKLKLNFIPNTKYSYCNTNYALLALITERVMHKNFPQVVHQLVFDPLKMKNSMVVSRLSQMDKLSPSYSSKHAKVPVNYLDAVYGDKNVYTTCRDLFKLDKAFYSDSFLSEKMKKEMFQGYSYERKGKSNYGLGIRMREEKGKSNYFFHSGWWHGSTACYSRLQADSVCIVAISNVFNPRVYQVYGLANHFGNYPFKTVFE